MRFEYTSIQDTGGPLGPITKLEETATEMAQDGWRIVAVVMSAGTRTATLERQVEEKDITPKKVTRKSK